MSNKTNKIFLVWNEDDAEYHYWEQYDSLADAVSNNGDGTEVWEASPKRIGVFKREVSMVRVKNKKISKAKK